MRIALVGGMIGMAILALLVKLVRDYSAGRETFRVRSSAWRYAEGSKKVPTPWWIYPAFGLGGLILFFWFLSRVQYAYAAAVLLDTSKATQATITEGRLGREDAHYSFQVDGKTYSGQSTENLAKGATFDVLYDPDSPSTNRPANGLWFDLGAGTALFIGLLAMIVWLIPFRGMSTYPEPQSAGVREYLQKSQLVAAVEALPLAGSGDANEEIPRVAESILAAWRKRPDLHHEATKALQRMEAMAGRPAVTREIRAFQDELLPRPIISSLIDVRSILDGWMLEVVHDMLRKMKQSPHEFLNMRTHLHFVVRQAGRIDLSLQVVVQILVRVQLRRVTLQVEYFDPLLMRRNPRLHCRGQQRPQAVHDQEHFPRCAPQQPAQEHQEQGCRHRLRVGHEPNLAVVRDRRDLVRSDVRVRHILGRGFPRGA